MPETEKPQSDFYQLLLEMRAGRVLQDINTKFNQVLSAVLDTGSKGKVTIELSIDPGRMGIGGAVLEVELSHNIKLKTPEHDIGRAVFFVNKNGVLTREDPEQAALFSEVEQLKKDGGKRA
jgi:hypothetical protein